jgi:phosphatidylglycerol:prolipoprotein diacylglycerol transferase
VHPTQIYESLVGLALFGLLMLIRKYRAFSGQVFLAWVLGYGIMRPLIEIVRDDDQRGNVGPLSTSQFIGLASVVLGLALLVQLVRKYRRDPQSLRLWQHVPVQVQAKVEPSGGKRRKRG